MRNRSKIIAVVLCIAMAFSCLFAGVVLASADDAAAEPITIVSYPDEFTGGITDKDLKLSRKGLGGENVTNLEGATIDEKPFKEFVLYNGEPIDPAKINVHYCNLDTFAISFNDKSLIAVGATLELLKGLPIPNADKKTSAGTLGESFKLTYTQVGWRKCAPSDTTERTDIKVKEITPGSLENGRAFVFHMDRKPGNDITDAHKKLDAGRPITDYILLNGEPMEGVNINMMTNSFWFYKTSGFEFKDGDVIELLPGLHFPTKISGETGQPDAVYGFDGYLGTGIKVKRSNGVWAETAEAGAINKLNGMGAITTIPGGATTPERYEFSAEFKFEASEAEASNLEEKESYSANFFLNGKSVKEINDTIKVEGYSIPAVSISAVGTQIKLTVVKSAGVIDPAQNVTFKIGKEFKFDTGHVLTEDIERYYIPELEYWSDVKPYEIEKTEAVNISSVSFDVIDNGVNGSVDIVFDKDISDSTMLLYSGHPEYLLSNSVPSGAGYAKEVANALASSGATRNILEKIYINDKSVGDYWKDLSGAEAKSSRFQMHILSKNTLSIRSNVSNGFGESDNIKITFKAGFTFFSGAYIEEDTSLIYNGELKTFVPESVAVSADKTDLKVGETATISVSANPGFVNGEVQYASSDPSVLKVEVKTSEDGETQQVIVTALKSGTATVTATLNGVAPNALSFTVAKDPGENPGGDPGENPGEDPGENPGGDPGENPGGDPGENPGDGDAAGCSGAIGGATVSAAVALCILVGAVLFIRKKA